MSSRDTVALGPPTRPLRNFPACELTGGQPLHRGHRAGNGPWWFSSDGGGRFDLTPPRGTCYLAYDELTVANDGIAVIVNATNPLKSLTKKQVEQIFTGDVADWSAVGGAGGKISVYTRNTSSGTYSDWKELAMKKRDYAPTAQKMAGHEQIAAEVGKNANGIGYVGLAYIKAGGIKVVPVEGALPSVQSVHAKAYPYARPTFYYTNGEPAGLAKAFVEFTVSPAGQKIAENVGFVPVK